ncbi:type II toxin-antitoxin system RelE/ParE family toxin [Gilliamella sp. ESL0254]|uniref:type II toxin-antitoxin system RelE/ParE family toxin n=1 Tax=Gilliamella sp. ESL0254 TaxID=2705035 RepID=UPI001580DE8D|nr:type II toxin-antitoxin system RelE/ParE family toxin [Gilliamella sp. ESL0254]
MLPIKITQHAAKQLKHIYEYSIKNWSQEKAKEYISNLHKTISLLAQSPSIAMQYEKDICYFPSQSHIIYFIQDNKKMIVLTVLHKSCLPSNDPILQK